MSRQKSYRFPSINALQFIVQSIAKQSAAMAESFTQTDLQGVLPLVARGKVRDLYDVDDKTLLFVATDRISAYDVIMENVHSPLENICWCHC